MRLAGAREDQERDRERLERRRHGAADTATTIDQRAQADEQRTFFGDRPEAVRACPSSFVR